MKLSKFLAYFLLIFVCLLFVKIIAFTFTMFFWIVKAILFAALIAGFLYLFDFLINRK